MYLLRFASHFNVCSTCSIPKCPMYHLQWNKLAMASCSFCGSPFSCHSILKKTSDASYIVFSRQRLRVVHKIKLEKIGFDYRGVYLWRLFCNSTFLSLESLQLAEIGRFLI